MTDLLQTPSTFFDRIGDKLGLGPLRSEEDLVKLVERGLPTEAIAALRRQGLTDREIHALIIPRRTLSHRRARGQPLTPQESDRVVQVARAAALADEVFGETGKALRWLRQPKRRFEGRTPMDLLGTDAGTRLVEDRLYQIDAGMFA